MHVSNETVVPEDLLIYVIHLLTVEDSFVDNDHEYISHSSL